MISCDVTNTGKRAGAEVAQLYIGDSKASVPRPVHELKGFEKVLLKPGEKKTVTFTVTKDHLAYYSVANHAWVTDPGEFTVSVGSSSRDLPLKGNAGLVETRIVPIVREISSRTHVGLKSPRAREWSSPDVRYVGHRGRTEHAPKNHEGN